MGSRAKNRQQKAGARQEALGMPEVARPAFAVKPTKALNLPDPLSALRIIEQIERLRDTRLITLFAYPDVLLRNDIPLQIYKQLRRIGRVPRIDLYINSTGGQSEVPWRMITIIRNFCDEFSVLVPFMAYSATTHIAMGADHILMGDMSELGPVDPARTHPLLPKIDDQPIPISVQDLRHFVAFLKREAGEPTADALATMFTALFDKVHPLALGAIEQSYALAKLISKKALETHMDPVTDKPKIERIVNAFADEFFSHHYQIGWKEAKDLGLPVTYTEGELWEAMWRLYEHYEAYNNIAQEVQSPTGGFIRPIAWIDTTAKRQICQQRYVRQSIKGTLGNEGLVPASAEWIERSWPEEAPEEQAASLVEAETSVPNGAP